MTDISHGPLTIGGFGGSLIVPGSIGYDEAREVFNGMVDRRPLAIARCRSVSDVQAVVDAARERGLPLSVYGGGHGVTGSALVDDGLCLDLREIDHVVVDAENRIAHVGGGCTWRRVDEATQQHGLAVTGGRVSSTGVGGLTLGSGSGWLERAFGYTCDSLLEAEVVTADGRVVTASLAENSDLFWALRGGGGNFGVVTRFTFGLHPLGPIVLGGMLMYPAAMAGELVRFWRDFMTRAPDAVGTGVAFITAPPMEFVPEPLRGQPVVGVVVCHTGEIEEAERDLAPLLQFGPPAVNLVTPMPYAALQQIIDPAAPRGMLNYWTADFLDDLPDEAVDALIEWATRPVSPMTQILLIPLGGAVARVPEESTALGQRDAPWNVHYLSMWADPADTEVNVAYTREVAESLKPWSSGRLYLNFIGDEGPDRVAAAYGPDKFGRLRHLKHRWDPGNLFRHNQNIPPES